jgi:hypothetical protein
MKRTFHLMDNGGGELARYVVPVHRELRGKRATYTASRETNSITAPLKPQ